MTWLKKMWQAPLGKLSISFTGLLILLFSLTINPLIIYFLGEDVPIVIYDAQRENPRFQDFSFVEVGVRDLTEVSLDVFSETFKETYGIDTESPTQRFFNETFYAEIRVENNRARVFRVVDQEPTTGIYLKIDFLSLSFNAQKTDANFEETGEYIPVYDGVQIVYPNLIPILNTRIPQLTSRLETEDIPVTLRIYRGNYIFVNP